MAQSKDRWQTGGEPSKRGLLTRPADLSPRRVSFVHQEGVISQANWLDLYQAALLEDNATKLRERIEAVHKAIHRRLVQNDYITPEEREKMDSALRLWLRDGKRWRRNGPGEQVTCDTSG